MEESILVQARASIKNKEYIIGSPSRYNIITVKITSDKYYVLFLDNNKEIQISTEVSLKQAKLKGMRMWIAYDPALNLSNLTMYHFKHNRPNDRPWQKDALFVLQDLLDEINVGSNTKKIRDSNLKRDDHMNQIQPKNIILYGPPGTGKTYNMVNKSLILVDPNIDRDLLDNPNSREEAVALFNEYIENDRIKFCTFHQSFSYEEFVEGYRFNKDTGGYEVKDGIFKEICRTAKPETSERHSTYQFDENEINFFKMSLGNIYDSDSEKKFTYCIQNNVIALGYGKDIDYSSCVDRSMIEQKFRAKYPNETSFNIDAIERFKNWMEVNDIVIISSGNKKARAIGRISGDYYYNQKTEISYNHFRPVEWLYTDAELPVSSILKGKQFMQQTIYMFYREDINVELLRELLSERTDTDNDERQYVLIIDEINRGNISKIFGELITLIEPDKRNGNENKVSVTLPYSGDTFSVPKNLHILGTMNTADRSIALLDTALRRRFDFIEMMPDYSLLPEDVDGVNIRLMLRVLNERIEYLFDRDHVLGHALFLNGDNVSIQFYLDVMKTKVIPLLQEYFYDNWEQIELVLGGSSIVGDVDSFLWEDEMESNKLFGRNIRGNGRKKYILNPNPSRSALINIYKKYQADVEIE